MKTYMETVTALVDTLCSTLEETAASHDDYQDGLEEASSQICERMTPTSLADEDDDIEDEGAFFAVMLGFRDDDDDLDDDDDELEDLLDDLEDELGNRDFTDDFEEYRRHADGARF